ncbi:hypothetical protein WJX84_005637 [Apatococcus fuscideae]|uniref:Uncharacterized protein n=1 Tax=Apatococcus fuscideae TaxID=2026836 RepID=A0AAW1SYV7_9CHLO
MDGLVSTASPLALAVSSATCGDIRELQQNLTDFAATISVFEPSVLVAASAAEGKEGLATVSCLDTAARPILQNVLTVLKAAARNGQLDSLRVLRQTLTAAAWSDIVSNSEQLYQSACEGRQASAFLWLTSQGLQATRQDVLRAARAGLLNVLRDQRSGGHSLDAEHMQASAHSESADCLRFLHQNCGLPLPSDTCLTASRAGSVECLRYAHRQGCQLTEALIPAALHNHGSKKTQQNCGSCIRWLLAHRCPVPHQLDPTDLYIVSVKRHMLKERRTSSLAVLRQPSLSGLSSVPLSCCERILQAADLWTPATVPTALSGGFGRVKRRRLQSAGAEAAPALV